MVTLQVFTFSRIDQVDARIGQVEAKLDGKIDALGSRVDALPARISEEFRAMRADMTAQTNAIANAITAARQPVPPVMAPSTP